MLTLSLHRHGPGFFPGTGGIESIGAGAGVGHSINVPLRAGVADGSYIEAFKKVGPAAFGRFQPAVIIMQCGADALSLDPLGDLNLGTAAYVAWCALPPCSPPARSILPRPAVLRPFSRRVHLVSSGGSGGGGGGSGGGGGACH